MSLRRNTGEQPATPAAPAGVAGPVAPPAQAPRQPRSADDVYSFLTSFSAGVQRGLDETQSPGRSEDDDGNRKR
jgi:hypothetical protein